MDTERVVLSFASSILTNIIVCLGTLAMFNWVSSNTQNRFTVKYRVPIQIGLGLLYLSYLAFLSWSTTVIDVNAFGMHWTYLNMLAVGMFMLAMIVQSKLIAVMYSVLFACYYVVTVQTVNVTGVVAMAAALLTIDFVHHYKAFIFKHRLIVYGSLMLFASFIILMIDHMAVYHLDGWFWFRQWSSLVILAVVSVEYNYMLTRQRHHERII